MKKYTYFLCYTTGPAEAGVLPWLSAAVGKRLQEKKNFKGFCELEQKYKFLGKQTNLTVYIIVHMYKSSDSHVT